MVDQNGNTHKLSDYKGKTVFLNFWATWCPPCRAEMPDIQKMYEDYGKNTKDLIVLGVAGTNVGNETATVSFDGTKAVYTNVFSGQGGGVQLRILSFVITYAK